MSSPETHTSPASRDLIATGLLLAGTVLALAWANSSWAGGYADFFHHRQYVIPRTGVGGSLEWWINDALMALFFFLVGLEIKREVLAGELSSWRKAALPVAAAFGGMAAPAMVFMALMGAGEGSRGWGVPMATDIAFALGALAVVARRLPPALRIFLATLAVADDLGALAIIAVFYTKHLSWPFLLGGIACTAAAVFVGLRRVRSPIPYLVLGIAVWYLVLRSGVHPTMAGVLTALAVPLRAGGTFPLKRVEHVLAPWVLFLIVPVFALANAGVSLAGGLPREQPLAVSAAVGLGLLIGKPVGILLATWLAVRLGLGELPRGVRWMHIHGVGWLGGIGFTMALFIAQLAYQSDTHLLAGAKVGILVGSTIAAAVGLALLAIAPRAEAA